MGIKIIGLGLGLGLGLSRNGDLVEKGTDPIPPTVGCRSATTPPTSFGSERVGGCWRSCAAIDSWLLSLESKIFDGIFAQLCSILPHAMRDRRWVRVTLPYMCTIFYMDTNNFGLLPSLLPLALSNTTSGLAEQRNLLQITTQVATLSMVLAEFLTFCIDIPLRYPLIVYTGNILLIYAIGGSPSVLEEYDSASKHFIAVWICCSHCINHAVSGYVILMSWRKASMEVPAVHREDSSRLCGYADQISSFVGSLIALPIVLASGSCY